MLRNWRVCAAALKSGDIGFAGPGKRDEGEPGLLRTRELTALRLITLHNLAFIGRLMADLRAAIAAGTLAETAAALRAGAAPGAAA